MNAPGWRLQVAGPARRDLERIPPRHIDAVLDTLVAIEGNPRRLGKQLRFELEGLWVARRGPFRIIYEIDQTSRVVTVVKIAHRAHAYRPR